MKKIYKSILAFALALMLLLSLSGCGALDQMRSEQAHNLGYGTIRWNGETYRALPICDYLYPIMDYTASIYVTDEDVPVLLSTMFHQETLDVSVDKNFLHAPWTNVYYCREPLYEELCQRIKAPFEPDMICYEFSVYNEDTGKFEDRYYKLTDGQIEGLEEMLRGEALPNNDIMWEKQYWGMTLYKSSEDRLLKKDYMDIYYTGNGYFLLTRPEGSAEQLYAVPQKFNGLLDKITAAYKQQNGFIMDYELDQIPTFAE